MNEILDNILSLSGLKIQAVHNYDDHIEIELIHEAKDAQCPNCQQISPHLHQNHSRFVRDLPWCGKPCYLKFTKRRFDCHACHHVFSELLTFIDPNRDYTTRYEEHVYQLVRRTSISAVAELENLTYDITEGIFLHRVHKHLPIQPFEELTRLGVDEIAEHKGRGAYDLLLYNLDTGKPIDMLKGRTKAQFKDYLNSLPPHIKHAIEEVCTDMWRPYADAVKEILPNATLVTDRFHVMKTVNNDLKDLKNQNKKKLPKTAKACHYPLLKNESELNTEQKKVLQNVYKSSPILKRAHQLKEQFRNIFETITTTKKAKRKLKKWICKVYKYELFPTTVTAMKTWFSSTLNYFHHRTTNGVAEGVNNKVKLIKRCAFGFRNFDHFRLRVLAAFQ